MSKQLTLEELAGIPLFGGVPKDKLSKILSIISYESHGPGVKLILDGDFGDCVYILLEGDVEITKMMTLLPDTPAANPEKSLIKLNGSYKPFIGELSLFDEESKRTATVKSLTPVQVAVIKRQDFMDVAEHDFEIGFRIMLNISRTLAKRLGKANVDILKLTTAFSLALTKR
ncbi:MAG: cyclic nucleotide-binding domain-containing protein [Bacteroidetes bacterium]|nr:cyclic nucleotide-binding domain-containing protein [Bacteroidota bacterium]